MGEDLSYGLKQIPKAPPPPPPPDTKPNKRDNPKEPTSDENKSSSASNDDKTSSGGGSSPGWLAGPFVAGATQNSSSSAGSTQGPSSANTGNPAGKGTSSDASESDSTHPAAKNRVFSVMMKNIEHHGQGSVRGWHAWSAVGNFENLIEGAGLVAGLSPEHQNEMISRMLDFAQKFPDTQEGYIVAAALLSAVGQTASANPDFAANLSEDTRRRLSDLALRLDAAAPNQFSELLEQADNMENFVRNGQPTSNWNDQTNAGDIDFAKGIMASFSSATDALRAVLGEHFVPAMSLDEAAESISVAFSTMPPSSKEGVLAQMIADAQNDPLFAMILAIIQASEDKQTDVATAMSDASFDLDEQSLATVQHQLQKASKLLEMGMGMLKTLHEMQDQVYRGFA